MGYRYDGDAILVSDGSLVYDGIGKRESKIIIELLEQLDWAEEKIAELRQRVTDLEYPEKSDSISVRAVAGTRPA